MSLFGPPNVDKLRKKGKIGKLVGLLTHKDTQLASSALSALQQIAEDKELEQNRKRLWELYNYTNAIKKIEKLDYDNKSSIEQLTKMLILEEKEWCKKAEAFQIKKDELKKRFEDSFKSLSGTTDDFFIKLMQILGENKDFLYIMNLPGKYSMSSFSGVIVTKDEIIYFELNLAPKVIGFRFEDIIEFSVGGFWNESLKIKTQAGDYLKIPIGESVKDMVAFIEEKYQKVIKN